MPTSLRAARLLALPFAFACGVLGVPEPVAPAVAPPAVPAGGPSVGVDAPPALWSGAGGGAAIERIRKRGQLRVGMDTGEPAGAGTPPMYFADAAGKPDGFDHQVAKWVASAIGVPDVTVVHGKYSELPAMLVDNQTFDLLISGYIPTEGSGVLWSESYLEFGLCLVVTAGSDVRTVADLWGKPVGIFDDDAAAEAVAKLVKGYTALSRIEDGYWDSLLAGTFAGFIYDYPYAVAELAEWYAAHPGQDGAFKIAQYNLTDSTYAVGARTTEPELIAAANEGIRRFRASEEYGAAVRRYLSGAPRSAAPESGGRTTIVARGDTLGRIAERELGASDRWREVWDLNKSRFPNPHLIEVGDVVVLPG